MKKFLSAALIALVVTFAANICAANIFDEPCGENVRVSDIGAEKFLASMKTTKTFRETLPAMNWQINFTPLTHSPSLDKPNNGLSAWTSLFYDEQNIGGTLVFYVNGEGYVSGVSMYGYPNNKAGNGICVAISLMAMEVIGVDPYGVEFSNKISNGWEENPRVKDECGIKIWCEKTQRMVCVLTSPKRTLIFATKW